MPNIFKDALIEYTAQHLNPRGDMAPLGALVRFWTPYGYMAGVVRDGSAPDSYLVELKSDDVNRLITIDYVYSSLAHGPHWKARPAYDQYNIRDPESWERFKALFPYNWQRGCIIDD